MTSVVLVGIVIAVHAKKHHNAATIPPRHSAVTAVTAAITPQVLPLDEIQKLNAKPKLLEDLKAMEAESAGWFADADVYEGGR